MKYFPAGALHNETGKSAALVARVKSLVLFISKPESLNACYRRAKELTLTVDTCITHKSRETQRWLKADPKFSMIYKPVYSPWVNNPERYGAR